MKKMKFPNEVAPVPPVERMYSDFSDPDETLTDSIPHPCSNAHPAVRRAYSLGWAYCFYESRADGKFRFISLSVRNGKREKRAIEAESITDAVEQLVPK